MKVAAIQLGKAYHDGKAGLREVVSIDATLGRVNYRILAAKVEREYSHQRQQMVSLIGTEASCDLASFAKWARHEIDDDRRDEVLTRLAAKKLRLAPGETAFMASVSKDFRSGDFPANPGASVSIKFNETRTAKGVAKKGLLTVSSHDHGGDITLTALGAQWIRNHIAASTTEPQGKGV